MKAHIKVELEIGVWVWGSQNMARVHFFPSNLLENIHKYFVFMKGNSEGRLSFPRQGPKLRS